MIRQHADTYFSVTIAEQDQGYLRISSLIQRHHDEKSPTSAHLRTYIESPSTRYY